MVAILDILDNLISLPMLTIGYVIDNIILILINPFGFVAIFSSITFLEYATVKSIIKDIRTINLKKILIKSKNYKRRGISKKHQPLFHNNNVVINSV